MNPTIDAVYRLPGRSTRAIVDLDAIGENVRILRRNQRPHQGLMAVVKADGYGHGAVMTARAALEAGAERLGVATVGEAAALRSAAISAPILNLGPIDHSEIDRALQVNAELTVGSRTLLDALQARAEALGTCVYVHVEVDSGMHRYGVEPADARGLIEAASTSESVRLAGVCTHLTTADDPLSPTSREQLQAFSEVVASVRSTLTEGVAIHASNSAASIRGLFPDGTFDRVGIALYGLRPGVGVDLLPGMQPALTLVTRVARVHGLTAGEGVSYGHTYRASTDERIALLPIGYGDGYRRLLSNRAWVTIGGERCPVRGRVCMDQTVVGNVPVGVEAGAVAVLAGSISPGPSVDLVADWAGTINYEIVAALSPRIPRVYVRGGEVVATLTEGQLAAL